MPKERVLEIVDEWEGECGTIQRGICAWCWGKGTWKLSDYPAHFSKCGMCNATGVLYRAKPKEAK